MKSSRFKINRSVWIAALSFAGWLAAAPAATAATIVSAIDPETPSAFEYTHLVNIMTTHPQVRDDFDVRDMFGGQFGIGQAIFQDTPFEATTYAVTFTLDAPIELMGYTVYLQNDGNDVSRGLSRFQLLMGDTVLSDVNVSSTFNATYGTHFIAISDTFEPVEGTTFTVRFFGLTSEFNGVRVHEIDAVVVPEPSLGTLLLGVGAGAFTLTRRRRTRNPDRSGT